MIEIIIAAIAATHHPGFSSAISGSRRIRKSETESSRPGSSNGSVQMLDAQAENMRREALVEAKDEALKMKQDAEQESKSKTLMQKRCAQPSSISTSVNKISINVLNLSTIENIRFPPYKDSRIAKRVI